MWMKITHTVYMNYMFRVCAKEQLKEMMRHKINKNAQIGNTALKQNGKTFIKNDDMMKHECIV